MNLVTTAATVYVPTCCSQQCGICAVASGHLLCLGTTDLCIIQFDFQYMFQSLYSIMHFSTAEQTEACGHCARQSQS